MMVCMCAMFDVQNSGFCYSVNYGKVELLCHKVCLFLPSDLTSEKQRS